MPDAVTVSEAARALDVSLATVRRWLREGAPCVRRGGHGPGRGALIDVAALDRWRRDEPGAELMDRIGVALADVLKRDAGEGLPAHRLLGIRRRQAAALLAVAFERVHRAVLGRDASTLPAEIERAVRDLPDSWS